MTATVAQLGARALRKLGISLWPDSTRPAEGAVVASAAVAARVLLELGIPVAEASRPAVLAAVGLTEIANRALRAVGVNPIAAGPSVIGPVASISAGVLSVVTVVPVNPPGTPAVPVTLAAAAPIITATEIASRALLAVGVNPVAPGSGETGSGVTYAVADIALAALLKLAVIASDETPSTADQTEAQFRVSDVHDILLGLDFVIWPITAIPASVAEFYIIMAANLLAPQFGKPAAMDAFNGAQEMIRQQALTGAIAQARAQAKVQTVHDVLAAEDLLDWTLTTIPDSVADSYVTMTASLLAPVHGKPVDPQAYALAMANVRRQVLSGPRGQALAETKVQAVHETLNAAGLVAWPVTAVPAGQVESYVSMAAILLAPVMGYQQNAPDRQVDTAAWDAAEASIRKAAIVAGAQARAEAKVLAVQGELNDLGLIAWDAEHIPASLADAVAAMAAMQMGPEFGRPFDPKLYGFHEGRVRRVSMGGPAGQALAVQKVIAVHASLAARGRVRWTLYDLPSYAEEPYVFMAAALLGPECDVKPDPNWSEMAERDLMRIVSLPSDYEPVRATYF